MTATDLPATDFASIAADSAAGFGMDSAPAAAPTGAAPAAPAAPAAKPAVVAAPAVPAAPPAPAAPAKAADGSLLGKPAAPAADPAAPAAPAAAPVYDLKADTMHADDIKAFAGVLGENKVEAKVGQAILDKMLPALKQRADAQLAEAQTNWRAENAKDPASAANVEAALSVVSESTREALRGEVYIDHPALYRFVAEMGAFVQKATKQDTAVNGASPVPAPKFDPANTSSAAFAGGVSTGF